MRIGDWSSDVCSSDLCPISIVRYIYLHNEAIAVQVVTQEPTVTVSLQFFVGGSPLGRQSVELADGVLFRSVQAVMGSEWKPWSVCFTHAQPASFEAHHRDRKGTRLNSSH